jgi:hypothetical protein
MRFDESAFPLLGKVDERLPGTFNNFQLAESLHLPDEVYHLGLDDTAVVPVVIETCNIQHATAIVQAEIDRDHVARATMGMHLLGSFSNDLDPLVTLIQPCVMAASTLFNLHRW